MNRMQSLEVMNLTLSTMRQVLEDWEGGASSSRPRSLLTRFRPTFLLVANDVLKAKRLPGDLEVRLRETTELVGELHRRVDKVEALEDPDEYRAEQRKVMLQMYRACELVHWCWQYQWTRSSHKQRIACIP
jgi:hypothetical protein